MTMTLSEKVRRGIRDRAAAIEGETGEMADVLLTFALEFENVHKGQIEAAFLKGLLRGINIHWNLEEFLGWLGTKIQAAGEQPQNDTRAALDGALAMVQWQNNRRIPKRWKKPIYDHLKSTMGIKLSFPHPGISLDTFLSSGS